MEVLFLSSRSTIALYGFLSEQRAIRRYLFWIKRNGVKVDDWSIPFLLPGWQQTIGTLGVSSGGLRLLQPGQQDGLQGDHVVVRQSQRFKPGHNIRSVGAMLAGFSSVTHLQMVLCERAPTPGSFRLARALPTSAWVTPSFILRCLNLSAKASMFYFQIFRFNNFSQNQG